MKLNSVPARTGLTWIGLGFQTFRRQPFALGGIFFLCLGAALILKLLPFAGWIASMVLAPAFQLGVFSATRKATQGEFPMPSTAFEGLRSGPGRRHLLILGVMFAASMFFQATLVLTIAPMGEIPVATDGTVVAEDVAKAINPLSLLLSGVFHLLIYLTFFHTPALAYWHNVPPVKAIFFSVAAFWANKGAMMVFLFAWTGIMFLGLGVSVQIGILMGGLAAAGTLFSITMLLLAAVFSASMYFCYQDSFISDSPVDHRAEAENPDT